MSYRVAIDHTDSTHPTQAEILQFLQKRLLLLLHDGLSDECFDHLQVSGDLLQALPLPTDHFGLAQRRLQSAARYLRSHEVGAARFELRALIGKLKIWLDDGAGSEPRRRLCRPIS